MGNEGKTDYLIELEFGIPENYRPFISTVKKQLVSQKARSENINLLSIETVKKLYGTYFT
jgi:hypothetical protein